MKKILIIALLFWGATSSFGQNDGHLKFKGIPVDGDYKAFSQKLIQKGFKQIESTADGAVLKGNFMAIPDVMVVVYPDPTSKRVSAVTAMIDAGDNWYTIENKYHDVVASYKEKYGEPTEHVEEFVGDVHDSDSWRLSRLHDGQCNYNTFWDVEGGRIGITLIYFQLSYYVVCAYVDAQNMRGLKQTVIDDI